MRFAVFSDTHSNIEALKAFLSTVQNMNIDKMFCLGDTAGYGANPNECIDLIRFVDIPTVMGNHDECISKNVVPWDFWVGGELLHNNHHADPASPKLSRQWYEFDIGWFYITVLKTLGLAKLKV